MHQSKLYLLAELISELYLSPELIRLTVSVNLQIADWLMHRKEWAQVPRSSTETAAKSLPQLCNFTGAGFKFTSPTFVVSNRWASIVPITKSSPDSVTCNQIEKLIKNKTKISLEKFLRSSENDSLNGNCSKYTYKRN